MIPYVFTSLSHIDGLAQDCGNPSAFSNGVTAVWLQAIGMKFFFFYKPLVSIFWSLSQKGRKSYCHHHPMLSLSKIESAANFSHSTLPLSSSFSLSLNWVKYVTNFMPEQPTSFQPFLYLSAPELC